MVYYCWLITSGNLSTNKKHVYINVLMRSGMHNQRHAERQNQGNTPQILSGWWFRLNQPNMGGDNRKLVRNMLHSDA